MSKTTEALKLAEEALVKANHFHDYEDALVAVREALANHSGGANEMVAEPVNQEPVAVISESAIGLVKLHSNGACLPFGTQLYAAPVQPVKQEPVAWHEPNAYGNVTTHKKWAEENGWLPLYTKE